MQLYRSQVDKYDFETPFFNELNDFTVLDYQKGLVVGQGWTIQLNTYC